MDLTREQWIDRMADSMASAMRELFLESGAHAVSFRIIWTEEEPEIAVAYFTQEESSNESESSDSDNQSGKLPDGRD